MLYVSGEENGRFSFIICQIGCIRISGLAFEVMTALMPMKNGGHFDRLKEILVLMTFSLLEVIVFLDYGLWPSSVVSDFSTRVL